jgi:flagellar hook-length control protein FliK
LKAPTALANGMNHPAATEAVTATQTTAAAPAAGGAPTAGHLATQSGDGGAAVQGQPAMAAFAALVEPTAEPAPAAAVKFPAGAPTAVGGVAAPAQNAGPSGAHAAVAAKATPQAPPEPPAEQIAVHIAKASSEGLDKISVKLKPESLGHVQVRLDVGNDGRTQVVVSADRPDTLDLLQRDAQSLVRALNDAGLQTSQQNLSFNLRDQGMPQGNGGGGQAPNAGWRAGSDGIDEPLPVAGSYHNGRAAVGGVDIRV